MKIMRYLRRWFERLRRAVRGPQVVSAQAVFDRVRANHPGETPEQVFGPKTSEELADFDDWKAGRGRWANRKPAA